MNMPTSLCKHSNRGCFTIVLMVSSFKMQQSPRIKQKKSKYVQKFIVFGRKKRLRLHHVNRDSFFVKKMFFMMNFYKEDEVLNLNQSLCRVASQKLPEIAKENKFLPQTVSLSLYLCNPMLQTFNIWNYEICLINCRLSLKY